ncbi:MULTISPECIES: ABC transporter permease [Halolamina]|uniref:Thiamine transport system permease protein n=1 Tax=Halolamina pelagica TaxID=699431 RepID=A0A1I5RW90_9EURY|nr:MULTISPECIES: iron ABC transporter permease [Halolamina]NHX35379.1 iron ABC transporter permease [Halolamina sp. R1-12]SFP62798.1 thiamine transport system permease protein [Halolamina pelagica]
MSPSIRQRVEAATLPLAGLVTLLLLTLLFYYPVGRVLSEAVWRAGGPTAEPLLAVLSDPFFFGVAAQAVENPAVLWTAIEPHTLRLPLPFVDAGVSLAYPFPDYRLGLFGFTAYQALLSTLASVVLGLPGAYVLARFEFPGRRTVRSLTAVPFVMPSIMVAIGFIATFGRTGVVNTALTALGLPRIELLYTLPIIVIAHAFYNAPLVMRVTAAAWEGIDAGTAETARSLGASPRRAFVDVVLPQLLPAILTGALLTFVFSFMSFAVVLALGGLSLATVEVWVYQRVTQLDYETASALATLEMVFSLVLTYAYLRYEARQRAESAARPPERKPLFGPLNVDRLAVWGYVGVALVVFVTPMASMVLASVTGPNGFTLEYYRFLVERQTTGAAFQIKPLTAIRNSLLYGAGSLALAVPMGVLLAVVSTREFPGSKLLDTLSMAPFAVSGVVVGLGLLQGLVFGTTAFGYRFTVTGAVAVVAAHAVAAYPFVTRNVAPLLATIDRSVVESARVLGASRVRVLLDIELPQVVAGVLAGAAFAFAISVGEFDSTVILASGSAAYTMPVAIERFLGRRLGPATAMGCVLLVVTAVSFLVIDRLGEGRGM